MNAFTEADIKQLIFFAMSKPEFLPFDKACFVVAGMTQDYSPEQVRAICATKHWTIEALCVPRMSRSYTIDKIN